MSTVKGAVMWSFMEPLKIESVKLKDPRPDEIVVKLAASGVCHSDLSVVQAKIPFPPPVILGHEGAGHVEEVGKDVKDFKAGDPVVLCWVQNCGKCHYCVADHHHLCEANIKAMMNPGEESVFEKDGIEIARMAGVGSFAERTIVRATAAVKIDSTVPMEAACLVGCGVMTGVGAAINTVKIEAGDTVAVFGCGGVGLNVIQGAVLRGAAKIIAVDLMPSKLELAKQFGATDLVNAKDNDPVDAIRTLTGGHGVDYAFEVIGAPAVITQAFNSLKRGGKAVIVGVPGMGQEVSVMGMAFALEEKSLVGSLYGSANMRRDMPKLLDLYLQRRLKLDELISRRIKLEDVNTAFEAMEKGEVARSVIVY